MGLIFIVCHQYLRISLSGRTKPGGSDCTIHRGTAWQPSTVGNCAAVKRKPATDLGPQLYQRRLLIADPGHVVYQQMLLQFFLLEQNFRGVADVEHAEWRGISGQHRHVL